MNWDRSFATLGSLNILQLPCENEREGGDDVAAKILDESGDSGASVNQLAAASKAGCCVRAMLAEMLALHGVVGGFIGTDLVVTRERLYRPT